MRVEQCIPALPLCLLLGYFFTGTHSKWTERRPASQIIRAGAAGRAWEVLLSAFALQKPENIEAMLEASRLHI